MIKLLEKHLLLKDDELILYGGGPYHIETSPLIQSAKQWTGFYMRDLRHERVKLFQINNYDSETHLKHCETSLMELLRN